MVIRPPKLWGLEVALRQYEHYLIGSRTPFCFVNFSALFNRTEMVLYSKCPYGYKFSGENRTFGCRDIQKKTVLFFQGHPIHIQTILIIEVIFNIWNIRRCRWLPFWQTTDNDVRGHYFHDYFLFSIFSTVVYFSHSRSAQIKNPIQQNLTGAPKSRELGPFPNLVGHFGVPWQPFWIFEVLIEGMVK